MRRAAGFRGGWVRGAVEAIWTPAALIGVLALVVVFGRGGPLVFERQATTTLIYVVAVVGLYTFVGNSGVLSFGHVSFMVVGAYVTAFSTMPSPLKATIFPHLPTVIANMELGWLPGVLLGAGSAGIVALAIGVPIARLPSISAGLAMLAFLLGVNSGAREVVGLLTGGQISFFGVPQGTTLLRAFLFASIAIVVAYVFQRSRVGLRLKGSREDLFAANASGINVTSIRVSAFVLSGMLMGLSGGLFVQFLGALAPDTFFISTTLITLAMLVVGGMYSLSGAVIGTVLISALDALLREVEGGLNRAGLSAVALAILVILILIFRPSGVTRSKEIPVPSSWRVLAWSRSAAKAARTAESHEEEEKPSVLKPVSTGRVRLGRNRD